MKYYNWIYRNEWVELNYKEYKLYEKKAYNLKMPQNKIDLFNEK